ncbi:MAG: DMT family transporter [Chloroflexota bacterium]
MTTRRAILLLVAANLCSAGTYVAGKAALASLSSVELNFLRFGLAGVVFLPLLYRYRRSARIARRDVPRLAFLCLCGFVLNKAAEYTGLGLTTASDTALLIAFEGVCTAVFGWVLLRESVRSSAVGGLALSVAGVYLVIERGIGAPRMGGGTRVAGDLLVVGALVFEALYSVRGKAELQRYPGLVITAVCVLGSLLVWTPAAGVDVALHGLPHMTGTAWLGVLYLAIGGTVLAYVLWIVGLGYVDAATAAPVLLLQPLAGTCLAVLLLGDRLTWATIAGGSMIIAGIWIVSRDTAVAEHFVSGAETLT